VSWWHSSNDITLTISHWFNPQQFRCHVSLFTKQCKLVQAKGGDAESGKVTAGPTKSSGSEMALPSFCRMPSPSHTDQHGPPPESARNYKSRPTVSLAIMHSNFSILSSSNLRTEPKTVKIINTTKNKSKCAPATVLGRKRDYGDEEDL